LQGFKSESDYFSRHPSYACSTIQGQLVDKCSPLFLFLFADALTVLQGFKSESDYFSRHSSYASSTAAARARMGVPLLSRFLSRVLLQVHI